MAGKRTILNLKQPQLKSTGWLLLLAVAGVLLILLGGALGRASQDHPTGNALAVNEALDAAAQLRSSTAGDAASLNGLERDMSGELERILTRITGAGKVTVSVSLTTGTRVEYGANVQTTERKTEENDRQGGIRTITEKTVNSQPVVLRESSSGSSDRIAVAATQRAEIGGVLVVAEGAGDSRVRDELTRACMTLLDLPAYRIKVVQGKVGE